jgi:nitroimidazol reductase NimA-like FMN-containing flavoprotein (pyridoxamine 5'-phosphate oxidase superfamily)
MPPGYGIPKDKKGLLPWSHVTERMAEAMHYWVCTVSPDGRPHATPVDGLWLDDQLYFGGSPQTRRNRNLAANPAVCIHLESGMDVVILHGEAHELRAPDRSLTTRLAEASAKKYGWAPKPEDIGAGGTYVFRPRVVLAWKQFPKDATRWQFQNV